MQESPLSQGTDGLLISHPQCFEGFVGVEVGLQVDAQSVHQLPDVSPSVLMRGTAARSPAGSTDHQGELLPRIDNALKGDGVVPLGPG
jgi:hypothetical protein